MGSARHLPWTAALLLPLLAGGCAATGPRGSAASPRRVAEAALRAAARGELDALEPLLDEEGRAWLRSERGRGWLAAQRAEQALRAGHLPTAPVTTTLRWTDARGPLEVALRAGPEGRPRIRSGVAAPDGAPSPRAALRRLAHLLERVRGGELAGLLAPEVREVWLRELDRLLGELRAPEAVVLQVDGDRARATTPSGRRIELRRVEGAWFVGRVGDGGP